MSTDWRKQNRRYLILPARHDLAGGDPRSWNRVFLRLFSTLKPVVAVFILLFTVHCSLFTPSAEARFLIFGKKKAEQEKLVDDNVKILKSKKPQERIKAAENIAKGIGKVRDKRVIEELIKSLREEKHPLVRKKIIEAMGRAKDKSAIQALKERLKDEKIWLRSTAIESLEMIKSTETLAVLKEVVFDKTQPVNIRVMALSSLSFYKDEEALNVILEATRSKNPKIRAQAICSLLRKSKDKRAITAIKKGLNDKKEIVRDAARQVVDVIKGKNNK